MYGPRILARSLSTPKVRDSRGLVWQYHSRSDVHSKIGSWGVAFDLLATSSLLRSHAEQGKVVLGVNHEMRDYATGRKKDLDLVFARPIDIAQYVDSPETDGRAPAGQTLQSLAGRFGADLTSEERGTLDALPPILVAPVGAVLIALEAKATMTAHVKALPRLYDELNSSHLCVHGASSQALSIAYVQVNIAETFVSPNPENTRRLVAGEPPDVSRHRQPDAAQRVLDKVAEIPRRSSISDHGFDAVGVSVLELHNDGRPVRLVDEEPAPQPGEAFHYGGMIIRMANEYDAVFARI